eukprot:1157985-Pelagomonas_calceolata.AAC.4
MAEVVQPLALEVLQAADQTCGVPSLDKHGDQEERNVPPQFTWPAGELMGSFASQRVRQTEITWMPVGQAAGFITQRLS